MDHAKAFGRRTPPETRERPAPQIAPAPPVSLPKREAAEDEDLLEWKRANPHLFRFPWRLFLLMAGLSFGVASFVLPDQLNEGVQWLLYGLSAASFYAGLRKRK